MSFNFRVEIDRRHNTNKQTSINFEFVENVNNIYRSQIAFGYNAGLLS